MSANAITVKDVTKVYRLYDKPIDRLKESLSPTHKSYHKDFYALNGLSFNVEKGQTVGIIGTNGSGKSLRSSPASSHRPPVRWTWRERSPRFWNLEPGSIWTTPELKISI